MTRDAAEKLAERILDMVSTTVTGNRWGDDYCIGRNDELVAAAVKCMVAAGVRIEAPPTDEGVK